VRSLVFAANWKMHLGPSDARAYCDTFLAIHATRADREVWFFPSAVSLEAVVQRISPYADLRAGMQDVHWEAKGAFTGAVSVPMAAQAGARAALVGHSERRHIFGETDAETGRKLRAILNGGLAPVLCVGETLAEREAGQTLDIVRGQLEAGLEGLAGPALGPLVIAYEPVWAIGTGRNATPSDAAAVHEEIRHWLVGRAVAQPRVLYGGSVNRDNVAQLLAEPELDGVLVGGASLDPEGWAQLVSTPVT
jgi:triosephosphate isomerase